MRIYVSNYVCIHSTANFLKNYNICMQYIALYFDFLILLAKGALHRKRGHRTSHQTIATRIEELGNSVEKSLKSNCTNFKFYSLAMDESTDASDTAQLAIFIRGIDEHYNITEEMVSLVSLKDTTKSVDLFDALKTTMKRFSLSMKNLSAIITDGAPAMVGKNGGLVKMVNNEAVAAGNTILMAYHCIVHQGNLCGKI